MHAGIRHAVQPLRLGVRHVILNNGNNESRSLFTALHKVVIPAKKRSPLYSTAADSPQTPSEEDHDSKPFEIDTGHASSLDASPSVWSSSLWPEEHLDPGLFIVPTPIGNLGDITLRALRVLRSSSLVLAEDTRHTRKLLNYFGLKAELLSCHDHNEKLRVTGVIQRLREGQSLSLVSDAGMPGISDPGSSIIAAAVEAGIRVIPLPGACAFISALVASGLPTTTFTFHGFLPPKSAARRTRLAELQSAPGTQVFYAPPHSLQRVLSDMVEVLGGSRRVCVARELTKVHEELYRSTLQGALEEFQRREPRGEICLVLEGADGAAHTPIQGPPGIDATQQADGDATLAGPAEHATPAAQAKIAQLEKAMPLLRQLIESGVPMSAAAKDVAKQLGVGRKELYDVAMKVQAQVKAKEMDSS